MTTISIAIVAPASSGFEMFQVGEMDSAPEGVETVQDYIDYCAIECNVDLVITDEIDGKIYGQSGATILKRTNDRDAAIYGTHYEAVFVN